VRPSNVTNFHETWYERSVLGGHPNSVPLSLLQQPVATAVLNVETCGAGAKSTFSFRNDAYTADPAEMCNFYETMFVTTIRERLVYRDDGRSKFL
jgi:hypothetical protein